VRIGHGYDVHRLVAGRALRLGGVDVPHPRGLEGHSDGDVLLHAVTSALLGAMGEGDLGVHFPSTDPALRGIASGELVARAVETMRERELALGNLDATLVAQVPRLAPHLEKMRAAIADLLGAPVERVNVKATSTDHLGHLGRGEGIAAFAVVLLEPVR
jgi:2-C-methyl-D-erythritol 2,4-cyclodiphosphate synthase